MSAEKRERRADAAALGTRRPCGRTAVWPRGVGRPVMVGLRGAARIITAWIASTLLGGCAATLTPGETLFRDGDYAAAASAFRSEESDALYDPELKRMLAAAWLRSGEPARAAAKLEEAIALAPADPLAWFLLADARAELGDPSGAIQAYQQHLELGGGPRREVEARIARLSRELMAVEVRHAIAAEPPGPVTGAPHDAGADSTVAVSAFLNVSGEEELASLSAGLAAVLITDLRKVDGFRVLERERLGVLREELLRTGAEGRRSLAPIDGDAGRDLDPTARAIPADGESGDSLAVALLSVRAAPPPVDARSAPRLGRLLRAGVFVQGFYSRLEGERLLLGADVVSSAGEARAAGDPLEGLLSDVLFLEKGLARRVLAALGVAPTEAEERALDTFLTTNPDAFLAWARGLYLLDLGRTAEAREAFAAAVAADPGFVEAAEAEALAAASEESFGEVRAEVWESLLPVGDEPTGDDGLIDVAVRLGGGPAPDGTGSHGEGDPEGLLGPSDPDRIDVTRRIADLPPPPGGRP